MVFTIAQFAVVLVSLAIFVQVSLQATFTLSGTEETIVDKTELLNSSLTKYLLKHGHLNLTDANYMRRARASEVPKGFEDQVVEWLVAEYGINVEDMHRLVSGGPVCGKRNCTSLPSMGSVCCPFG